VVKESVQKEGSDFADVVRHVIVGNRGESCRFALRYFELAPGVRTTPEQHLDEHVVICVRGRGKAVVGAQTHLIAPLDTLFITGNDPHQLVNEGAEPFGFFCVVGTEREESAALLLDDELQWLQESAPGVAGNRAGEPDR
jgi:quercetin dioxygenase-like cupin family protein